MREIKFRGYAVEQMVKSQWLFGFGVSKCELTNGTSEVILYTDSSPIQVHEKSVGQYTGLKDKNGREIYEGDIVDTTYDSGSFIGVVVYDLSELGFKATNGKEHYRNNFQYLPCCEEVEIIGNIYENPELLEVIK